MRRTLLSALVETLLAGFERVRARLPAAGTGGRAEPAVEPSLPFVDEFEPAVPAERLVLPAELARSMNGLGVDLYGQLGARPGNLAISPASLTLALAMTQGGARGETAAEMARVLSAPEPAALHGAAKRFVESVAASEGRRYTLHLANRLFGEKTYRFEEPFVAMTRESYGAPLEAVDFAGAPGPARERINGWVASRTRDRIRDLLPPPAVGPDTRLVLANALYFYGPWAEPFEESATASAAFHVSATESVEVPTMHRTERYWYARAEGVRLLGLPYAGGDLQMTIVLPDERDGLAAVERSLSAERIAGWLEALERKERVAVALPRFTIQPAESVPLRRALEALGMRLAFDRDRADFSGMARPPDPDDRLYVSDAHHKAFVEVTERGTEAAAATAAVMVLVGAIPSEPVPFVADHPFLFLIHSRETGGLLFLGRLVDPR